LLCLASGHRLGDIQRPGPGSSELCRRGFGRRSKPKVVRPGGVSNADHTEPRKEERERQSGEEGFGFKKALGFGPRLRPRRTRTRLLLSLCSIVSHRVVRCRVVVSSCRRVVSPLSLGPDHPQSEKLTWPEPEKRRADPGLVRVSLFW
jgi:hypothetical protein